MSWQHDEARKLSAHLRAAATAARTLGWISQADLYEREADLSEQGAAAKVRLGDWPEES